MEDGSGGPILPKKEGPSMMSDKDGRLKCSHSRGESAQVIPLGSKKTSQVEGNGKGDSKNLERRIGRDRKVARPSF